MHTSSQLFLSFFSSHEQAFHRLSDNDKATLAEEMARTGIQGQSFSTSDCAGGPAFLVRTAIAPPRCMSCMYVTPPDSSLISLAEWSAQVYYSPAFLRKSSKNLLAALQVLASVYRAARTLFPLNSTDGSGGTLVYIDQLNAAGPAESLCSAIGVGQLWMLVQTGDCEAVVQRCSIYESPCFDVPATEYCMLHISTSMISP